MAKYRKIPVVVEAVRYFGANDEEIFSFSGDKVRVGNDSLIVPTLSGDVKLRRGWWLLKGVDGELYPCEPGIFEKTYEKVE